MRGVTFPALVGGGWGCLALVVGCAGHPAKPSPKASGKTTKASATPPSIAVTVGDLNGTIWDSKGNVVATVKASGANAAPQHDASKINLVGMAQSTSAVLYQKGKPAATLDAPTIHADRDRAAIFGSGGVTLRSLTQPDTPAIRADTMTWHYGEDHVVGQGHVLVTRQPDMRLPGTSFVADTQIRTLTLYDANEPNPTGSSSGSSPAPARSAQRPQSANKP